MYLLVYRGTCNSVIINGIKFTKGQSSANIDDTQLHLFASADGKSYYDDLTVVKIEKEKICPTKEKKEFTVEFLKKEHKLEELQAMCKERNLSIEGSKTELAERIIEVENK